MAIEDSVRAEALLIARGLCLKFEGICLKPYICPAGVPTIGVGATTYDDGRRVTLKDRPISLDQAKAMLDRQLSVTYLPAAAHLCPNVRDSANRLAGIGDFAMNLGATRLAGSALRRKIAARDWDAAGDELMKWVRGGGKILPGLVTRRAAERALLIGGNS